MWKSRRPKNEQSTGGGGYGVCYRYPGRLAGDCRSRSSRTSRDSFGRARMEGGIRAMKYWCYYANVVRYLEKVEALLAPKTRGPAYLVWTDDDGPHMIAGPGIHWYRGDGPMPDLDALEIPASIRAARVSKRLPANPQSTPTQQNTAATLSKPSPANAQSTRPTHHCRPATWRKPPATRVEPPARHNPETSVKPATRPQKRRTNDEQLFRNPLKPAHPRVDGGQTGQTEAPRRFRRRSGCRKQPQLIRRRHRSWQPRM